MWRKLQLARLTAQLTKLSHLNSGAHRAPLQQMKRSFDPAVLEMMDRPQPVSTELERDLERLRQLNRWFGSYRLVSIFMRRWIMPGAQIRVVDLATGSGDIPVARGSRAKDWRANRDRCSRSASCNPRNRP